LIFFLGGHFIVKTILHLLTACFLITAGAAVASDISPDALVKSTVDEVLNVIKQNKGKRVLRELVEQKVLPNFDFNHMTQLAAGRVWREANPLQQQALESNFRTLLVNTYTSALSISATGSETVEIRPVQVPAGQDEVTVKTMVRDAGKQPIVIDYRLARSAEGWKIFDVVVENLSLVTNYRGTFMSEVGRSGIDGLIKVLEEKNRTLAKS
jgi:phospholipid transport system substrate-binding protein